jgi:hypothetical protein
MPNPLVNSTISPKVVQRIIQAKIVIDCGEPSNDDKDYYERKHNARMP